MLQQHLALQKLLPSSYNRSTVCCDLTTCPHPTSLRRRQSVFPEYADATLVNCQYIPHLTLPRGATRRFRILNAAAAMTYELSVGCAREGACNLAACNTYLLAIDGVYNLRQLELIDTSLPGSSVILFPGSRADIVLRCTEEVDLLVASKPRAENDRLLGLLSLRCTQDILTISITTQHEVLDSSGQLVVDDVPLTLPPLPDYLRRSMANISDTAVYRYRVEIGGDGSRQVPFVNPTTPVTRLQASQAAASRQQEPGGAAPPSVLADKTLTKPSDDAAALPVRTINKRTFEGGVVRHCVLPNSVQEWEIEAIDERLSTFTLQAHHFQVIKTTSDRQAMDAGVWRDVYGVSGGTTVTIRFQVTNVTGQYAFGSSIASDHDFGQVILLEVSETCPECEKHPPPLPPPCGEITQERAAEVEESEEKSCGDELRAFLEAQAEPCGGAGCVCDDGNAEGGDGCDDACRIEAGFECEIATCGVSRCALNMCRLA